MDATHAQLSSLEQMMVLLMKGKNISAPVVKLLWDIFTKRYRSLQCFPQNINMPFKIEIAYSIFKGMLIFWYVYLVGIICLGKNIQYDSIEGN